MTHKQMHRLMNAIIKEVTLVRDEGQKEYAHDEKDVFANFNRVANLLGEDRKKVLMTYMLKHIDGIAAYVKGHKSQREDVTGRITDCMVYLMLLWGMIEEEDGLFTGRKENIPMSNVFANLPNENIGVSLEGGCMPPDRIQPNGDMQKVRKARSRLEESQEVGTT